MVHRGLLLLVKLLEQVFSGGVDIAYIVAKDRYDTFARQKPTTKASTTASSSVASIFNDTPQFCLRIDLSHVPVQASLFLFFGLLIFHDSHRLKVLKWKWMSNWILVWYACISMPPFHLFLSVSSYEARWSAVR